LQEEGGNLKRNQKRIYKEKRSLIERFTKKHVKCRMKPMRSWVGKHAKKKKGGEGKEEIPAFQRRTMPRGQRVEWHEDLL